MDRKLTLELLRIAVKLKVVGSYGQNWKAEHWERLERSFESITQTLVGKREGVLDKDGKQIDAPDIRTAKNFLNLSDERIKAIRNASSDKVGKPESNTRDYLVRVLGLPLEEFQDFEHCMMVMQLHPDKVVADEIDILARITQFLNEKKESKASNRNLNKDSNANGGDWAMEVGELQLNQNEMPSVITVSKLESPTENPTKGSGHISTQDRIPNKPKQGLSGIAILAIVALAMTLVTTGGFVVREAIQSSSPPSIDTNASKNETPQVSISTNGNNSPIINNPDGDVYFIGGASEDSSDKMEKDSRKTPSQ